MKLDIQEVMVALDPPAKQVSEDIIIWKFREDDPDCFYIKLFDEVTCQINIKGEHDINLVKELLNEVTEEELLLTNRENPYHLSKTPVINKSSFGVRVIMYPTSSPSLFFLSTKYEKNISYNLFPLYQCEIAVGDALDELRYRFSRCISWATLNRLPSPALSARFVVTKTNYKSSGGKKMGIIPMREIEVVISALIKGDGFIDIENFERQLVHIEFINKDCDIYLEDNKWTIDKDNVLSWINVFAIEGVEKSKEMIS